MIAREIATALGGEREGRSWRCPCPVHGGRSLTLTDARDGWLLIHCFGGCESRDVFNEFRALGLIEGRPADLERQDDFRRRRETQAFAEAEKVRLRIAAARDLSRRSAP